MGRIIVEQIVSADGYAAGPDGGIGFFGSSGDLADPEMEDEQMRMLDTVGAIVLGRTTYAMFEAYWPDTSPQAERVATPINALPKYVVSSTLTSAPWGSRGDQARILQGDGVASLRALRNHSAGDLIVWGSLTLTDALLRAGEVDVLRLRMLPVLIGAGRSFAPPDLGQRPLILDRARTFACGAQLLVWRFA
ncbi:dihydrofolate reductase family protein [Luteimonas kalidii]|uniref:Dihydrofolate reductase family protein n=1 Tax=Luteimonas kalidii TaxID=3042025 RepID=A0ABT6JS28_9GAMM|nr:dihydrofolate reductase family protein [Luteimonas kalidii]MDH5833278.1 dihydrofolate reductase family protein [Luteimonas kalidii]